MEPHVGLETKFITPEMRIEKLKDKIIQFEESVFQKTKAMRAELDRIQLHLSLDRVTFEPHSGETNDQSIFKAGSQESENVEFKDQHDPYQVDVQSVIDPTRTLQDMDNATLANFFKRPVKIAEFDWAINTALAQSINPWQLFLENPRVQNRLTNYNLMRTKLHIKVVLNGNGFHYGRALCYYEPYASMDMFRISNFLDADLVQATQRPKLFLNPTMSTGGDMVLPFFFHKNYLNIPNYDHRLLGDLSFRTINLLKHANDGIDGVTITVFAWAEEMEMSVLTSWDPNLLSPQSGDEIDQANKEGMISGPATSVAKWAAYLSKVPYIGPFATATQIGANATASIAKLFGYCRPPITKSPDPYKPVPTASLAVTNVPDTIAKLTMDDKQELTIDPRIAGLGGIDPLNIREIAKREAFITKFTWAVNSPADSFLWNSRVTPMTYALSAKALAGNYFHFPPCAVAALPFQYWKGTMKFRFQIVASSFHKGRLKIVYDPNFIATTTYQGYSEFNTNYLKIVDLADETDFTVEIGNGQEMSFLRHYPPDDTTTTTVYNTGTPYSAKEPWSNGVIGVYVLNELTSPNTTNPQDVEINVYVSAGDDFEVAEPTDDYASYLFHDLNAPTLTDSFPTLPPQSGEETKVADSENTTELDKPQHAQSFMLGPPIADHDKLNSVFFGESITTFRTLLKRYCLSQSIARNNSVGVANANGVVAGRTSAFPLYRGNIGNPITLTDIGNDYNYANTLLFHWVNACFAGHRGSHRYKILVRGETRNPGTIHVQRVHFENGRPYYEMQQGSDNPATGSISEVKYRGVQVVQADTYPAPTNGLQGANGVSYNNSRLNYANEFEVPYYSQFRFSPGRFVNYTGPMNDYRGQDSAFDYQIRDYTVPLPGSNQNPMFDFWHAIGEDYQAYFWLGLPKVSFEPNPPPPQPIV